MRVHQRRKARGREETTPPDTTQSNGAQGDGPRTAKPPLPQQGTAADVGSTVTPPRHTAGTDGNRPEHGALTRQEYSLLAPAVTAVDPADAGDPSSTAGHGVKRDRYGRDPEEEG